MPSGKIFFKAIEPFCKSYSELLAAELGPTCFAWGKMGRISICPRTITCVMKAIVNLMCLIYYKSCLALAGHCPVASLNMGLDFVIVSKIV